MYFIISCNSLYVEKKNLKSKHIDNRPSLVVNNTFVGGNYQNGGIHASDSSRVHGSMGDNQCKCTGEFLSNCYHV